MPSEMCHICWFSRSLVVCKRETNKGKLLLPYRLTSPRNPTPTSLSTASAASGFDFCAMADISKPITFCEHLQLSSLAIQPSSIGFQVRAAHLASLLVEEDSIIHVRWALL